MNYDSLGDCIRKRRDESGLTLRGLARHINITPGYLSDVELGRRFPSDRVMAKIATALRTSQEELAQYCPRHVLGQVKEKLRRDPAFRGVLLHALKGSGKSK